MEALTLERLRAAAATVAASPLVRRTALLPAPPVLLSPQPLLGMPPPPPLAGVDLALKLETQQTGGSFKMRGVVAQLAALPAGARGCVTMSAGNYGRALALAARARGLPVAVCMADTVPPDRVQLLRGLGAEVVLTPAAELRARVDAVARERAGYVVAHPFDDADLVCGHATAALEILEEQPDVDVLVVPCGGGGLLAGVALAVALTGARARVVGVEPEGAPKMARSLREGAPAALEAVHTVAAGLAPPFAGRLPFEVVRRHVQGGIVLVSDAEIAAAMRALFTAGLVVEPSGAAAVAALLARPAEVLGDAVSATAAAVAGPAAAGSAPRRPKVVCILSGSNVSADQYHRLLSTAG